ncbi:MAG: hypothetical protein QHC90_02190 [Shinella sp.]|nr:hypothetical protein [Shinella sp.]
MSLVRAMEPDDVKVVAALFRNTFLHKRLPAANDLNAYMRSFYLDGPFREPDLPSLVHVADDGRISGFVGVHSVSFLYREKRLRAAFCGALMSAAPGRDPLAGARLLKAFLAGPQDISLSETANPVSQAMWERLHGAVLHDYSLEWFRILHPAGFLLATGALKFPVLGHLKPVAKLADRMLARRREKSDLGGMVAERAAGALLTEEVDREEFAAMVRRFGEYFSARPDWSDGYLDHVLESALDKPDFGQPVMMAVRTKSGETIGGFLYHVRLGGIGRVLQVLSAPGRCGIILDRLFADALDRGAVGLRGRSQPAILEAASGRSIIFATVSATVVHARDPAFAAPFLSGDCFLNGLAGESWNRFFGGNFR